MGMIVSFHLYCQDILGTHNWSYMKCIRALLIFIDLSGFWWWHLKLYWSQWRWRAASFSLRPILLKSSYHYLNLNQSLVSMFTVKIPPYWDTNEKEIKKKKKSFMKISDQVDPYLHFALSSSWHNSSCPPHPTDPSIQKLKVKTKSWFETLWKLHQLVRLTT